MSKVKLLKDIKGFDNVGIGVIWCDEGKGTYIGCADLEGYDLTGVQIYSYHNFFRTMRETDDTPSRDTVNNTYFVKREDLV